MTDRKVILKPRHEAKDLPRDDANHTCAGDGRRNADRFAHVLIILQNAF
jgi:hypothetical protein